MVNKALSCMVGMASVWSVERAFEKTKKNLWYLQKRLLKALNPMSRGG
jgi:hypothetical protein